MPVSDTARARRRLRTIPATGRSSTTIVSWDVASRVVSLCGPSRRSFRSDRASGFGFATVSPVDRTARWRTPRSTPTVTAARCRRDGPVGTSRSTSTVNDTNQRQAVRDTVAPSGRRCKFAGYAARARPLAVLRRSARVYFQSNGAAVWL